MGSIYRYWHQETIKVANRRFILLSGEATLEMEEFLEQPHIKAKIFKLTEKYDCEKPNGKSLTLDFSELEKFSPTLADNLVKYPDIVLPVAKQTLEKIVMQIMGSRLKANIRFKSLPPQYSTTVQKIGALHINTLTEFECVTNLVSDRLTQLQTAAFECQFCNQVSFKKPEKKQLKPMTNRCSCGHNTFVLKEDLSDYIDLQRAQSQELVERAHNPTATPVIELWLEDDLTNYLNAGEKVRITGILRTRAKNLRDKDKNTIYSKYVDVVHIQKLEQDEEEFTISPEEEKEIIALSKHPKRDEILISSMAPYISGHGKIKEALLLQQFGGTAPNSSTYKRDVMHILIIGDPSCLVAGSRIVNSDGTFSKIETFGDKHLQTINRNIMIDERTNALTTQFHKYSNQPLIEIITETGKSIVGTYNHPLRVLGDDANSWKRLDEICVGDKLETITRIPCTKTDLVDTNFKVQRKKHKLKVLIPNKVTPELAGLMGYVLGDGHVNKYVVGALVNLQEEDLIDKLNTISKNCFGKQFVINKRIFSNKLVYFKKQEHPYYRKPIFECYLRGIDVAQNLIFLREKRVPDLIMQSRNDVVSEFLAWLFEADGCVFSHSDKERQIKGIQLRCGEQRIELLRDVQLLLLRFGIHSSILEYANDVKLVIRRGKSILAFDKNIGFKSKKKKEKLAAAVICAKNVSRVIYNEIYERVVSVKQVGLGDVYDIHVPQYNSFIANGIISHNTSKTELTRFVAKMSPKLVSATGGGSSGVGLCASVEKDAEFGGWIIKAGAAVLANNGTMAIDEFDKLGDSDKGLLHSVMTDQVVVITKAGKNVQLPARTSVLAVCNPKFGRFDPNEPTLSQFNIGEALRTRFDLIFVTRDIAEEAKDDAIMQKIVDAYLPKEQRAVSYNSETISPEKIKKYIAYARKNCKPVITDNEIVQEAVAYFRELRKTQGEQTTTALPHRYFESIIRIAGAYAKKRLSNIIDKEDFTNAVLIMDNSLKQYLVDPQTGKLDANLGDFGKTTSQLNQQHMMVLEIRTMCGNSPDGLASEFEYEKACIERLGIPEPRYKTLFNSLKTVGEITQQGTGRLRYRR